ncbi:winged helix-turn-helix transcriptional regulator [Isoptericola sp. F-RaC21]|uniref:winged helix-turn-helix transcriptional regulator n=1 Tax=Isoptericola sp. F-RaC21 TaxID=3141452 RepID=UPI00315BAA6A
MVTQRVEYSLTEHGRALNETLAPPGRWGSERIRREGRELVDHADAAAMPRP